MASIRARIRITTTFVPKQGEPGHGFKYVEGAIVSVSLGVAHNWVAVGKALPYDEDAKRALAAPTSDAPKAAIAPASPRA